MRYAYQIRIKYKALVIILVLGFLLCTGTDYLFGSENVSSDEATEENLDDRKMSSEEDIKTSKINGKISENKDATIVSNNCIITAEAFIWRDFMPPNETEGGPLQGSIKLTAKECREWPERLKISSVEVRNDDSIWKVGALNLEVKKKQLSREIKVTDGPKWETGDYVKVIVNIVDKRCNIRKILIIENMVIQKLL